MSEEHHNNFVQRIEAASALEGRLLDAGKFEEARIVGNLRRSAANARRMIKSYHAEVQGLRNELKGLRNELKAIKGRNTYSPASE